MKTERRHELQTNELAGWLTSGLESAKPYSKVILGIGMAIVVVLGTYWFVSRQRDARRAKSWDGYFQALYSQDANQLTAAMDEHEDSLAAEWAQLYIADQQLAAGNQLLFTDRTRALEELQKASENYRNLVEQTEDSLLQQRASFGLGKSLEAQGEVDQARQAHQNLIESWPESPFTPLAQEAVQRLSRPATKDYYTWLASVKLPAASAADAAQEELSHEAPDEDPSPSGDDTSAPAGLNTLAPAGSATT